MEKFEALRDPKISITPDERIMILMGATDYDGKTAMEVALEKFGEKETMTVLHEILSLSRWTVYLIGQQSAYQY